MTIVQFYVYEMLNVVCGWRNSVPASVKGLLAIFQELAKPDLHSNGKSFEQRTKSLHTQTCRNIVGS